ncbi:hypothetical protein CF326_g8124 [Tilletia indica]|nr:hypothetical protein CF326_g8124 [Tilletia indica]
MPRISTYLRPFHVGDIVDIKANAAEQKGMPHKYYHGRTGVVYNVAPRAVGVIVYKVVGNRYMEKRVSVRVEHVKHSKCRDDFLKRVKENAAKKKAAKEKGESLPVAPRESRIIIHRCFPCPTIMSLSFSVHDVQNTQPAPNEVAITRGNVQANEAVQATASHLPSPSVQSSATDDADEDECEEDDLERSGIV